SAAKLTVHVVPITVAGLARSPSVTSTSLPSSTVPVMSRPPASTSPGTRIPSPAIGSIVGAAGGVTSMVKALAADGALLLPAASIATAVTSVSASEAPGENWAVHAPSPAVVASAVSAPQVTITLLPGSAVPVTVTPPATAAALTTPASPTSVTAGASGASVSIVTVRVALPSGAVAVTAASAVGISA